MTKPKRMAAAKKPDALFGRVVAILDQARGNVVRAVNTNMVLAYWLIGREIVQDLQAGEDRAGYGKKMLADLSVRLAQRYGNGFSVPNLQNFRKFYLAYSTRGAIDSDIQYPMGTKSVEGRIQYPAGTRSPAVPIRSQEGRKLPVLAKGSPSGAVSPQGLSPQLSWSHYRAIMRVESREARPRIYAYSIADKAHAGLLNSVARRSRRFNARSQSRAVALCVAGSREAKRPAGRTPQAYTGDAHA